MLMSSKNFHQNEELTKLMKFESEKEGKSVLEKLHGEGSQYKHNSLSNEQVKELNLSDDL